MAEVVEEFYVVARRANSEDYFSKDFLRYPLSSDFEDALRETNKDEMREIIVNHWDNNFNNPDDYDFLSVKSIIIMETI